MDWCTPPFVVVWARCSPFVFRWQPLAKCAAVSTALEDMHAASPRLRSSISATVSSSPLSACSRRVAHGTTTRSRSVVSPSGSRAPREARSAPSRPSAPASGTFSLVTLCEYYFTTRVYKIHQRLLNSTANLKNDHLNSIFYSLRLQRPESRQIKNSQWWVARHLQLPRLFSAPLTRNPLDSTASPSLARRFFVGELLSVLF
jgi:hypothetical protein